MQSTNHFLINIRAKTRAANNVKFVTINKHFRPQSLAEHTIYLKKFKLLQKL